MRKQLKRILFVSLPIALVIGLMAGLFVNSHVSVTPSREKISISFAPQTAHASPAFTARTETYVNLLTLSTPFNITVTKPTGTVDGDILFCLIDWYAAVTIDSVPSGWNLLGEYLANTDRYALYYKVASGEGANWVWSFTATAKVHAVCSCYTSGDFNSTTPINVISNTAYRSSNKNVIAASMAVSDTNSPLIFWANIYTTGDHAFTKPSTPTTGWVEDYDDWNTTSDFLTEVCSFIWAGSGDTGTMTAVVDGTNNFSTKHAFAVALKPASAEPAITVNPTIYDFGIVAESTTPYTATNYFTITNSSAIQTDQTIGVTTSTWSGGITWTHSDTATPGTDTAGLKANRGGSWGTGDVIIKYSSPNYIYENCPATTNYDFGLKLWTPTVLNDGVEKSITVRITASAG